MGLDFSGLDSPFGKWPTTGGLARRPPDPPPEPEPEIEPPHSTAPVIKESPKVNLVNLKWSEPEGEFNESIAISADAELPEPCKHLTRVEFQVWALTPDGKREPIDKKDGYLSEGRVEATVSLVNPSILIVIMALLLGGNACANSAADSLVKAIARSERHRLISAQESAIHPVEDSLYQTITWKTYRFKASQPLKVDGRQKYYFDYYANVLTFEDSLQASKRLDSVRTYYLPEDLMMKKPQFGLQVGRQVILLSTHSEIYGKPLRSLATVYKRRAPTAIPDRSLRSGP